MKKIYITGATGNIGIEVIRSLHSLDQDSDIVALVRDVETAKKNLAGYNICFKGFDFTDIASYEKALDGCEILFLLRPPQISQVKRYFEPLIAVATKKGIKHILFLSVQGVEKSKWIPHHKIEKLIVDSKIPYTFLRPAYFMQNFTTTLRSDLVNKKLIFLPAGDATFTLVDIRDIGAVAADILIDPDQHYNKSYDLTANEKLSFGEMAKKLSAGLKTKITYESPSLLQFFLTKRKEKVPFTFILVIIALHYLPRFAKETSTTDWVTKITGRKPKTFDEFINDNKALLS